MKQTVRFSRRLNDADAKFFFMGKRPECNPAMVMFAALAGDLSREEAVETLAPYEKEISRFADYLRPAPLDIAPPTWMPVEGFRPGDYISAVELPAGSSWEEVLAEVDRIQSRPFVAGRAPWEIVLLRGAPEGRTALVMKVHHTLSDGMALTILFAKAFAGEALAAAGAEIEVESEPPPQESRLRLALAERASAAGRCLRRGAGSRRSAANPAKWRREAEAMRRTLRPPTRWPLRLRALERRLTGFRVPASVWKEAARERGGGANDLYLSLVARTMRVAFGDLDLDAEPLRVVMPVSLREEGVQDGSNATAIGIVKLPGRRDELEDLTVVRQRAVEAKEQAADAAPSFFEQALELLPGRLRGAIDFRQFAACDVVATNVPIPVNGMLRGVPIEMMFMVAPVLGAAASFSLTSYGEHLHLACNADRGVVSEPLDRHIDETLSSVFGRRFESLNGPES